MAKKYVYVIVVFALLFIFLFCSFYLVPSIKLRTALRNHDWVWIENICKEKLAKNPDDIKYKSLIFYTLLRSKYDADVKLSFSDSKIYPKSRDILFRMSTCEANMLLLERRSKSKRKPKMDEFTYLKDIIHEELSLNFTSNKQITQVVKYLSSSGRKMLQLWKGNKIDNYYDNILLAIDSSFGSKEASSTLASKTNSDSTVTSVMPYCGEGLAYYIPKYLDNNPSLFTDPNLIEYFAIMKASKVLKEVYSQYPNSISIADLRAFLQMNDSQSSDKTFNPLILSSWSKLNPVILNPGYNLSYLTELLNTSKDFSISFSMHSPADSLLPMVLTATAYNQDKQEYLCWTYKYSKDGFIPTNIENLLNPIICKELYTVYKVQNKNSKSSFQFGALQVKPIKSISSKLKYDPMLYPIYNYNGYYSWYGGYKVVDEVTTNDEAILTKVGNYSLDEEVSVLLSKADDIRITNTPSSNTSIFASSSSPYDYLLWTNPYSGMGTPYSYTPTFNPYSSSSSYETYNSYLQKSVDERCRQIQKNSRDNYEMYLRMYDRERLEADSYFRDYQRTGDARALERSKDCESRAGSYLEKANIWK